MKKNRVTDKNILAAASEIEKGLFGDDLGGNLFKKRIARPYEGKIRGYRSVYAYRLRERIVFMTGFVRRDKNDLSPKELKNLKELADIVLSLDEAQIQKATQNKSLQTIN